MSILSILPILCVCEKPDYPHTGRKFSKMCAYLSIHGRFDGVRFIEK